MEDLAKFTFTASPPTTCAPIIRSVLFGCRANASRAPRSSGTHRQAERVGSGYTLGDIGHRGGALMAALDPRRRRAAQVTA